MSIGNEAIGNVAASMKQRKLIEKSERVSLMQSNKVDRVFLTGIALLLLSSGISWGDAPDLVNRLPAGANAVVFINVESILNSKLGRQEKWQSKLADAFEVKPLTVPPDAQQVVMAAWLDTVNVQPVWEVSLIQVSKSVSIDRIARDTRGFTESLNGKRAARAPMDAYFVRLDKHLLGVVSPAYRQFAARWSSESRTDADPLSPNLRAALSSIGPSTDFFLALDLEDAVSEKRFRQRLAMEEFDCLRGKKFDERALSEVFASIRSISVAVEVRSNIVGKGVIEFERQVSPLGSLAKPLLIESLEKVGASIDDLADWKFTAGDTSITATGQLSSEGFRKLCSIVNPPSPTDIDDSEDGSIRKSAGGDDGEKSASQDAAAVASRRYYRAVSKHIDSFGKQIRTAESLTRGATYVARDARNISQLPILNVDPELVKWGSSVSSQLLLIASDVGTGGLRARSRAEGVLDPYARGSHTTDLEIESDPNDRVDRENAARMRRAAAAEEKTKILEQASQLLIEIQAGRAQIRAAMTEKYGIEFEG